MSKTCKIKGKTQRKHVTYSDLEKRKGEKKKRNTNRKDQNKKHKGEETKGNTDEGMMTGWVYYSQQKEYERSKRP